MGQCRSSTAGRTLSLAVRLEDTNEGEQLRLLIASTGGENISSLALESAIVTHPDVLEAAVVAIKDEKWGERPKVFATIKEGKSLVGEDVLLWAKQNEQISGFMVPKEVEVIGELPKTSTGKVRKNVLREWAKGGDRSD